LQKNLVVLSEKEYNELDKVRRFVQERTGNEADEG